MPKNSNFMLKTCITCANRKSPPKNKVNVAVVYHLWAHYREPIVHLMCQQRFPNPKYTIFSDTKTTGQGIKTIDPIKSSIPVRLMGIRWKFLKNVWLCPSKIFLWQKGVLRLAWDKEYDTIIFLGVMYFLSTWPAVIIARLRGKRVLMWSHGFLRKETGFKGWFRRMFYRLPHGMLLYGNWAKKLMVEMGFDKNTLFVVFNSLDYKKQLLLRNNVTERVVANVRANLFKNSKLPILLFIGRLTPQKRLMMLAEAVKKMAQAEECYLVNVLFIGDGPEKCFLEKAFCDSNLSENVHFFGACHAEEDLAPIIASADLCVAPGEVGLTAMHSMVYGTPVLTHDDFSSQMPEFEAITPGKNGDFFRKGDVDALVDKIKNWFARGLDRKIIQQNCYEVIDKFYNPDVQIKIMNAAVLNE
jgi:glycosyltransferase involved in cell wall biosynthesis